ncbi:MAG: ABC transporter ATP-binding protein [Rhodoplanes sp.]|nr:ABC transporter ATP-binding protein [Rhodoplanes sp.]
MAEGEAEGRAVTVTPIETVAATDTILETRGLTKDFGGLRATNDVSFTLARGAKEAIIGPNGAGKSTFFALVSGRHRPDAGSVTFDGQDVTGLPPHEIARRGMSRAFQVSSIFNRLTVLENVRSAVQVRRGRAFDFFSDARRVALDRTEEILALCRLADRRHVPAGELSQGDKKKLELALALAGEPRLLLLDEPTAGMSLEETRETMALVDDLNESHGLTILFTEHDMSVVFNHARRITLLHRGRMILSGSPAEVRANDEVQSIYLGGQA